MKIVMGEITDSTNVTKHAQGFSLMPVVWGFGATMGYVLTQAFGITSVLVNEPLLGH